MELEQNNQIWTKRFVSLFIVNMTVFFVFYGLVTTLPLYALDVLKQTEKEAGLMMAIFLLSAIIVRPFSGKLLDIFGKKKMMLIGVGFYLFSTVLYLFIKPLLLLLILRFFNGIWFSIVTTATGSLAADIVPASRKGAGLGYFNMSSNLSVVLGPFASLLLIQYASYTMLFIVMIVIAVGGVVMAMSVRVEDLRKPAVVQSKFHFTWHDLFEKKSLSNAALGALLAFSYASILSFMSVYAQSKGLMQVASWFYAVFAAAMLLARPTTGKIYDQYGPKFVIIPGFVSFIIGLLCLAFLSGPVLLLMSAVFVGIGYGALTTSFQSLAVQAADHTRSAYATATYFTLFDSGLAIGTYILGIVAAHVGYSTVYLTATALLLFNLVLYFAQLYKKSTHQIVSRVDGQ